MDDTAKLTSILDNLKEIEEMVKEERESDNYDNKRLKFLVNRRESLTMERDLLITKIKWLK